MGVDLQADRDEEYAEQEISEGDQVGFDLVFVNGFG